VVEDVLEAVVIEAESALEAEAGFVRVVDEGGVGGMVDDWGWWIGGVRCRFFFSRYICVLYV